MKWKEWMKEKKQTKTLWEKPKYCIYNNNDWNIITDYLTCKHFDLIMMDIALLVSSLIYINVYFKNWLIMYKTVILKVTGDYNSWLNVIE